MLQNIPTGTHCFVDANILYYSLIAASPWTAECTDFINRIKRGLVMASLSSVVVAEATHKLMLAEAARRYGLSAQGLAHRLQRRAHLITTLSEHKRVAQLIHTLNLPVEPVTLSILEKAADLSVQHRLLTNDSLTIAVMEKLGLTHLATNDDNFDYVPGLTVWKPR